MKKIIIGVIAATIFFGSLCQNIFAANYQFNSGPDYGNTFGQPTETDTAPRDTSTENVRSNKDVAFMPLSYGVFSGEIDTEPSNPYVAQDKIQYADINANTASNPQYDTLANGVNGAAADSGVLPSTSLMLGDGNVSTENTNVNPNAIPSASTSNIPVATADNNASTNENVVETQAIPYSDGSIGMLEIPKARFVSRQSA